MTSTPITSNIHRSQGFDPGPSLSSPPEVWSALAAAALSFVQFYPNGGDFEVGDGDAPDLSDDMLQVRAAVWNVADIWMQIISCIESL